MFAELPLGLEVVLLAQGNSQPTLKKAKKKKKILIPCIEVFSGFLQIF